MYPGILSRQRGVTFTGLIMGTFVFLFLFWLGMKIVPPLYLHMKVQKVLESIASDEGRSSGTDSDLRSAFLKRLDTSYLEGDVSVDDLTIHRTTDAVTLTVTIDKENPLFEGVAIRVNKDATVEIPTR